MYKSRINKIKGQLNGIDKMLQEERKCLEIVQQISAVRAALSKLGVEILKDEAGLCSSGKSTESLEKIIDNLFKIT